MLLNVQWSKKIIQILLSLQSQWKSNLSQLCQMNIKNIGKRNGNGENRKCDSLGDRTQQPPWLSATPGHLLLQLAGQLGKQEIWKISRKIFPG